MNKEQIKGKWNSVRGSLQQQWSHLSDADMQHINGQYDRLVGKLREHYGYTEQEAKNKIKNFSNGLSAKTKLSALKTKSSLRRLSRNMNSQMKRSPWTMAALTTVGGLLIGMWLKNAGKTRLWFK